MSEKISLRQLELFLWETADILRGSMDASEFKDLKHDIGAELNTSTGRSPKSGN